MLIKIVRNTVMNNLRKTLKTFCRKYWPVLIILGVVATFFWKVILLKQVPLPADFVVGTYYPWLDYKWGYEVGVPVRNPITTDVVSFSYPMRTLAVEMLKNGNWPLWNPYILTGTPLLANFQSAPFTVTNIFYFVTDTVSAWSLQIMAQHFLVAIFTCALLRYWGLRKISSLFGSIIFAFSGFNTIWSQWNSHTLVAAFIPLSLLFFDKYLRFGKSKYGIALAFAIALQIFAGYPQVSLYTALVLLVYWIVNIRNDAIFFRRSVFIAIFGILGLLLASPQLLPGAELLSLSQRSVESTPQSWVFLPWSKIITFFSPDYFGNHATFNYWGPQDYTSNTGFVGVSAFLLSGLSLIYFKSNKRVRYAVILAGLSLAMAFYTPLSAWIWNNGLLGSKAASAHRVLVVWNFAIAILASFGLDYFLKAKKIIYKHSLIVPYIVIIGFGIFAAYQYFGNGNNPDHILAIGANKYMVALRNLVIPTASLLIITAIYLLSSKYKKIRNVSAIIIILVLILELFRFGWKYTPFSPRKLVYPKTPVLEYLMNAEKPYRVTGTDVIPMNMRMQYRIETPEGYDAVYPQFIAQYIASLGSENLNASPAGKYGILDREDSRLVDMINTKYLLALKEDPDGNPSANGSIPDRYQDSSKYKLSFEDKTVAVLERNNAYPRALMVYEWEYIDNDKEILRILLDDNFPLRSKVILHGLGEKSVQTDGAGESRVSYSKYSAMESSIEVETNKPGMLFVSDLHYPGWKAFIDEQEVDLYRANYSFRAIEVPKGKHTVRFSYKPESFYLGLKMSAVTLIVLILFLGLKIKSLARLKK